MGRKPYGAKFDHVNPWHVCQGSHGYFRQYVPVHLLYYIVLQIHCKTQRKILQTTKKLTNSLSQNLKMQFYVSQISFTHFDN